MKCYHWARIKLKLGQCFSLIMQIAMQLKTMPCALSPCSCSCLPTSPASLLQLGQAWDRQGGLRNWCQSRGGHLRLEIQCNPGWNSWHTGFASGRGSGPEYSPLHAHDGECKFTISQTHSPVHVHAQSHAHFHSHSESCCPFWRPYKSVRGTPLRAST